MGMIRGDLVEAGDVCLDLGAGHGRWTARLAELVGPFGQVHAFEPRRLPRAVLRVRTWTTLQVSVVGAASGVDRYCALAGIGRVALLRIDAGGAEEAVLASAAEVLRRDRPVLLVRLGPGADPAELRRMGYRRRYGGWVAVEGAAATRQDHLFTPPSTVTWL